MSVYFSFSIHIIRFSFSSAFVSSFCGLDADNGVLIVGSEDSFCADLSASKSPKDIRFEWTGDAPKDERFEWTGDTPKDERFERAGDTPKDRRY